MDEVALRHTTRERFVVVNQTNKHVPRATIKRLRSSQLPPPEHTAWVDSVVPCSTTAVIEPVKACQASDYASRTQKVKSSETGFLAQQQQRFLAFASAITADRHGARVRRRNGTHERKRHKHWRHHPDHSALQQRKKRKRFSMTWRI